MSTVIATAVHLLLPALVYLVPGNGRLPIHDPLIVGGHCLLGIKHILKSLNLVLVVLLHATVVLAILIARIGLGVLNRVQIQLPIRKPAKSDLEVFLASNITCSAGTSKLSACNSDPVAWDPVAWDFGDCDGKGDDET